MSILFKKSGDYITDALQEIIIFWYHHTDIDIYYNQGHTHIKVDLMSILRNENHEISLFVTTKIIL